jgi:hypothetical protein
MDTRGSFPGIKRPGREADHSPPSSVEVKNAWSYTRVFKSFRTESITKYTLTTINTSWEATQKVMVAKLTRLTQKIAIQLHPMAESCTICSSRSKQPVRKLWNTPSYLHSPNTPTTSPLPFTKFCWNPSNGFGDTSRWWMDRKDLIITLSVYTILCTTYRNEASAVLNQYHPRHWKSRTRGVIPAIMTPSPPHPSPRLHVYTAPRAGV